MLCCQELVIIKNYVIRYMLNVVLSGAGHY